MCVCSCGCYAMASVRLYTLPYTRSKRLVHAVTTHDLEAVAALVPSQINVNQAFESYPGSPSTYLSLLAVDNNNAPALRYAVEVGANALIKDRNGLNVFCKVAGMPSENREMVDTLFYEGNDGHHINDQTVSGNTAVHYAVMANNVYALSRLLGMSSSTGAVRVATVANRKGDTALLLAIKMVTRSETPNVIIPVMLIRYAQEVSHEPLYTSDRNGMTPMDLAHRYNLREVEDLLLRGDSQSRQYLHQPPRPTPRKSRPVVPPATALSERIDASFNAAADLEIDEFPMPQGEFESGDPGVHAEEGWVPRERSSTLSPPMATGEDDDTLMREVVRLTTEMDELLMKNAEMAAELDRMSGQGAAESDLRDCEDRLRTALDSAHDDRERIKEHNEDLLAGKDAEIEAKRREIYDLSSSLTANLDQLCDNRVGEELVPLREQMEKSVEENRELREYLDGLVSSVTTSAGDSDRLRAELSDSNQTVERLTAKLEIAENSLMDLRTASDLTATTLRDQLEAREKEVGEIYAKMQARMESHSKSSGEREMEIEGLRDELDVAAATIRGLTSARDAAEDAAKDVTATLAETRDAMDRQAGDAAELETRVRTLTDELETLRSQDESAALKVRLTAAETAVTNMTASRDSYKKCVVELTSRLELMKQTAADVSKRHAEEVASLNVDMDGLRNELVEKQESLRQQISNYNTNASELGEEINRQTFQYQALNSKYRSEQTKATALQSALDRCRAESEDELKKQKKIVETNTRNAAEVAAKHAAQIESLEAMIAEAEKEAAKELKSKTRKLNSEIKQLKSDLEDMQKDSEAMMDEADDRHRVRMDAILADHAAEMRALKEDYQKQLSDMYESSVRENVKSNNAKRVRQLEERLETIEDEYDVRAKERESQYQVSMASHREEVARYKRQLEMAAEEFDKMQKKINALMEQNRTLGAQMTENEHDSLTQGMMHLGQ